MSVRLADTCAHAPSRNPRLEGKCEKCGTTLPASPANGQQGGRDVLFGRLFLEQVRQEVARRFGEDVQFYAATVEGRLDVGAERYGDGAFWSKDLIRELLEETPDVAAYAVLESQKIHASIVDDEDGRLHWLFESAVFGAMADFCARRARR